MQTSTDTSNTPSPSPCLPQQTTTSPCSRNLPCPTLLFGSGQTCIPWPHLSVVVLILSISDANNRQRSANNPSSSFQYPECAAPTLWQCQSPCRYSHHLLCSSQGPSMPHSGSNKFRLALLPCLLPSQGRKAKHRAIGSKETTLDLKHRVKND